MVSVMAPAVIAQPPSARTREQGPFVNTAWLVTPASAPAPKLDGHDAWTCCADPPAISSHSINATESPPVDCEMVHDAVPDEPDEPPPHPSASARSAIDSPVLMAATLS